MSVTSSAKRRHTIERTLSKSLCHTEGNDRSILCFAVLRLNLDTQFLFMLGQEKAFKWSIPTVEGSLACFKQRGYMVSFRQSCGSPDPLPLPLVISSITLHITHDELLEAAGEGVGYNVDQVS
ncbi:hypothetical protein POM88_042370 [Heracleum sosnowskyi]|uniref:Uncharacterized protein n=1 Tax=Heracleum sosnowskyi TaxID=360622 RepID=A0AAD8HI30_9APIA|nr:hypothetical protein POM88_042370 [Heracleum sosnowskyi]